MMRMELQHQINLVITFVHMFVHLKMVMVDESMEHQHQFELDTKQIQDYHTYNPFTFGLRPFGDIYYTLNRFFYSNPQVREV